MSRAFVANADPHAATRPLRAVLGLPGACLNGAWTIAKHCAAWDFDESWNWWCLSRPPMGAIIGLAVYVLSQRLGSPLGMSPATRGLGMAVVGLVAGFATERVTRKTEEVSKTLFAVPDPPPALSILEPVSGEQVAGGVLRVVVRAAGTLGYLRATCLEQTIAPMGLMGAQGSSYVALLPLVAPLSHTSLQVTAAMREQALTAETQIEHQDLAASAAAPGHPMRVVQPREVASHEAFTT